MANELLALAVRARVPLVSVKCDTVTGLVPLLRAATGAPGLLPLEGGHTVAERGKTYFAARWSTPSKLVGDLELQYDRFREQDITIVGVNVPEAGAAWFDAGGVEVPSDLLFQRLADKGVASRHIDEIGPAFAGLSLHQGDWLLQLAQAKHKKKVTRAEVADVRRGSFPARRGLVPVPNTDDFYLPTEWLRRWVVEKGPYFLRDVPGQEWLRPRGLLFDGEPGVGKTMAAKYIARELGVPLYRLDLGEVKAKFVGESEAHMRSLLEAVVREAPCVLLVDEGEKLFTDTSDDAGTTKSLLAAQLWWMEEHRARVLTVITTNDFEKLPPELYRSGRVDQVVRVEMLPIPQARDFLQAVLKAHQLPDLPLDPWDEWTRRGHFTPAFLVQRAKEMAMAHLGVS